QFLMHLLDFGMNPQEAIEAPRFRYYGGVSVEMEGRFPQDVRKALELKGHHVTVLEPWSMSVGGAQGFRLNAGNGTLEGGADPRRDGLAVGW
ncbi:MAG: gamma-glutamyltransferase, partial [Chloroflexi bacterium]|nr:gamma-glutamyltransferase [Chloroflexota bacterium]